MLVLQRLCHVIWCDVKVQLCWFQDHYINTPFDLSKAKNSYICMGVVCVFFRGRKKNRDEMGLIVFLIGVPRKVTRSGQQFFGYVTIILQKHIVKI